MGGPEGRARVLLARKAPCPSLRWSRLKGVLSRILEDHGMGATLSVAVVGDAAIQRIHREFLGKDSPTDVISFRLDGGPGGAPDEPFGEVVLSAETAARVAETRGLPVDEELALYAIHGTLHLVGLDDTSPEDRRRMRRAERRYLDAYRGEAEG